MVTLMKVLTKFDETIHGTSVNYVKITMKHSDLDENTHEIWREYPWNRVNLKKILIKFGENTRGTMVNYVKIYMSVFGITTMFT